MTTRGFSKDNAQTTVSNGGSAISSGATSVPVAAATNFPSSGVYCVKTPSGEVMQITGGQGTTTWTVVRGVGGTTAASIPDGATLKEVLSSVDMLLMAQLSDSRFTDSRTPTAHASTHASGGSDQITVADALITAVSASKLTGSHTLPDGTLSTNVPLLNVDNTFTGKVTGTAHVASGLTGATAASRYVGGTASGAPTTGTFAVGDFVIDQTGKVYICTTAGTPGTWVTPSSGGGGGGVSAVVGLSFPFTTQNSVGHGTWFSLLGGAGVSVDGTGLQLTLSIGKWAMWGSMQIQGSGAPTTFAATLKDGAGNAVGSFSFTIQANDASAKLVECSFTLTASAVLVVDAVDTGDHYAGNGTGVPNRLFLAKVA